MAGNAVTPTGERRLIAAWQGGWIRHRLLLTAHSAFYTLRDHNLEIAEKRSRGGFMCVG